MDSKIQHKYIDDQIEVIRLASTPDQHEFVESVAEFLWDSCGALNLRPFDVQLVKDGDVQITWEYDRTCVSVLFCADSEDWRWEARTVNREADAEYPDADGGYSTIYSHRGPCSFRVEAVPYYVLPDEVDKLISVPDEYKGTYYPVLAKALYDIVWVTNRYDGMLSGYCRLGGKLHYFDNVEETVYQRNRMFAIYRLSWLERVGAWVRHHEWNCVVNTRWAWNASMWFYRRRKPITAETHRTTKQKFVGTHHVVGYFER